MALIWNGTTLLGSSNDDFMFGHPDFGPNHHISAGDGDDRILAISTTYSRPSALRREPHWTSPATRRGGAQPRTRISGTPRPFRTPPSMPKATVARSGIASRPRPPRTPTSTSTTETARWASMPIWRSRSGMRRARRCWHPTTTRSRSAAAGRSGSVILTSPTTPAAPGHS